MRIFSTIACISLLAAAACTPAGYYDSNGVYRSYGKSDSFRNDRPMSGTPNTPPDGVSNDTYVAPGTTTTTTVVYTRPGYYDYSGHYVTSGPQVPPSYMPPQGMCRVWFPDREVQYQPGIESCTGLQYHVPSGAYVVYGG
jgi:hypothetical protein